MPTLRTRLQAQKVVRREAVILSFQVSNAIRAMSHNHPNTLTRNLRPVAVRAGLAEGNRLIDCVVKPVTSNRVNSAISV